MPYGLRKSRGRDLFWVYNKETGRKYSKKPLPRSRAEAQRRAIYATENGYVLNRSRSLKAGSFGSRALNGVVNASIGNALFGRSGAYAGLALGALGNRGFFRGGSKRSRKSRN